MFNRLFMFNNQSCKLSSAPRSKNCAQKAKNKEEEIDRLFTQNAFF